jgi:hypothetical protein
MYVESFVIFALLSLKDPRLPKFFTADRPRIPLSYIRATTGARSAPYETFTLVCHSEEPFGHAQDKLRDEESAFDFSVLVVRIAKSTKQMLHFVQHDT